MFSKHSDEQMNTTAAYLCPTSPWTEPYQAAPSQDQQPEHAAFDSDDQRPTLDALSDIYNRGYQ